MPFAFLSDLPGFSFWRTPGRMMFVGFTALGVASGFGLVWLTSRLPNRWRTVVPIATTLLVLFENWPRTPQLQQQLPIVPPFYEQIAHDPENYGVFDLPVRPYMALNYYSDYIPYSSRYEIYQMTHHKGIASGYISRYYNYHPVFAQLISRSLDDSPWQKDVTLNGQPANRFTDAQYELARNGYRYVVFHKPQAGDEIYKSGSWGEQASKKFINSVFNDQTPIVDDNLTTVYQVLSITDVASLTPTIVLRESLNTVDYQLTRDGKRWALSPATFYVASPRLQAGYLEVTPGGIETSQSHTTMNRGLLILQWADGTAITTPVASHETVTMPLIMWPGSQIITLTLQSIDPQLNGTESEFLNFAIHSINLQTEDHFRFQRDILANGNVQSNVDEGVYTLYGHGWYDIEKSRDSTWRWAQSPSVIWIYSRLDRAVQINAMPTFLHEPASPNHLGDYGLMSIAVNDAAPRQEAVQVGQSFTIAADLRSGWNAVSFNLSTGNFQEDGDSGRQLSFAVSQIDIRTP
jgi:hypothetical protein